ncbi:MAG: Glu/Leu/Phe/Val dehydrogenase [Nitrospinota bacterium]|nr:Glu/Leu/Phe/Val dehydrogenase [Nitrospinota bacterium]
MPEYDTPIYRMAVEQFDRAAKYLNLDPNIYERLKRPKRALIVSVPVRMDDGRVKVFEGYRVQHDTTLGPTKGGIRYHHGVNLGEVSALAMWMSWKCALAGLPMGGGKGGVRCRPETMSRNELQNMTRRYIAEIYSMIGPDTDIPAPDMGTSQQTMAWIMDTYSQHRGYSTPGVVTGKPVSIGGSLGRFEATGRGVVYTVVEAAKHWKLDLNGTTAVIQGFGNVGSISAKYLSQNGCKIIAASDSKIAILNSKGFDVEKLIEHKKQTKSLEGFPEAEVISHDELLEIKCDILIPAALAGVINEKNASKIKCKIISEGANGPTTNEADKILSDRGIFVIPDVLANSGGVIVSYFEWVQDLQNFFWSEEEINKNLQKIIVKSFYETFKLSRDKKVSIRIAALMLGIKKISDAMLIRGLYA